MAQHNQLGKEGEVAAENALVCSGHTILDRNWKCGKLELDIIARKDNTLVIVEVKTRRNNYYGLAEEAVDDKKIRKIIYAADSYIKQLNWNGDVRFDIITLYLEGEQFKVDHVEDAFFPPLF